MARQSSGKATLARLLALEITREVRVRDAYVRELVNAHRASSTMSQNEFDFAQLLCFGVVACVGTLDEAIDRSLNSPRDIKPKVRDALRISAYELLFLDKPDHVIVSQGVELVRSVTPRAAGLANAVLRKMLQDAQDFPWGDPEHDDAVFARKYCVPTWLAQRLIEQYGREKAAEILQACLEPAPRYLRENPFNPDEPFASDLSAQQVAGLVALDGTILEIGAGRGTKTMLLESRAVESLGAAIPIHAVDLHEYRAQLHAERMRAAGIECVSSLWGDARDLQAIEGLQDFYASILIDAPCSGTGTLRRHPEIRWHLTPDDVDALAHLQLELLQEAASRLAVQGTLVYATCSILHEENQQVIDAFLASQPQGAWRLLDTGFASIPTSGGPDGHFAAVLQRLA